VEEGDPEIIAVRDLLGLFTPGARREAVVHLLGTHHIHVERWMGHDEVTPPEEFMFVLVERVRLSDAFEYADSLTIMPHIRVRIFLAYV
jgi:hypothetical protein